MTIPTWKNTFAIAQRKKKVQIKYESSKFHSFQKLSKGLWDTKKDSIVPFFGTDVNIGCSSVLYITGGSGRKKKDSKKTKKITWSSATEPCTNTSTNT
jgi:hypothetical protein